jgi:hypothetical protein
MDLPVDYLYCPKNNPTPKSLEQTFLDQRSQSQGKVDNEGVKNQRQPDTATPQRY